jgi:hypothetical protein
MKSPSFSPRLPDAAIMRQRSAPSHQHGAGPGPAVRMDLRRSITATSPRIVMAPVQACGGILGRLAQTKPGKGPIVGLSGSWITPSATRGFDRLARAIFVVTTAVAVLLSLSLGGWWAMMAAPVILVVGFAITYVWGGSQDQRPARWYGTPIYRDHPRIGVVGLVYFVLGVLAILVIFLIVCWVPGETLAAVAKNIRRCTIEFDAATRRLRITSKYFGIFTSGVVDRPVQECVACGLIERSHEDEARLYVKAANFLHEFAVNLDSREAVSTVADQMSAVTGIARRDVML